MRLKNFINENVLLEDLAFKIKRDCKQFIKELERYNWDYKKFLFRGLESTETWVYKKVRKNRRPTDTHIDFHNKFDEAFKAKFGIKLRSESVFCTTGAFPGEDFGYTHLIFPTGKYRLFQSEEITDLMLYLENDMNIGNIRTSSSRIHEIDFEDIVKYKYKEYKRIGQLKAYNEIMMVCDSYYALHLGGYMHDFFRGNQENAEELIEILKRK